MKVLISKKTGNYYYYNGSGDYHCKEGFVKEVDIKSGESVVLTNTRREFLVFDANFYDLRQKLKRGPQIITAKDLGYVVARGGVNKESFVVEAGAGSGAATVFFASIAKKVHSYEIRGEHCKIVEKNLDFIGVDNVQLKEGDLVDFVEDEKNVDLLFLDMPDPVPVLSKDLKGVKSGAYIVCYVPSVTQIIQITDLVIGKQDLYFEEVSEVILRHWRVGERVARPENRKEIDHTAFLVFVRKI